MPAVRTNDVRTYYERRGDGPPVVFVHASVLDHAMWDRQAAALDDDYETIVYDLRGHGRTGGSSVPEYTVALLVEDLHALLAELDVDRPVLCGLSLGGTVAMAYAASYPDRVAGLILADAFLPRILTRGEWFLRRVVLNALIPPVRVVGYERVEEANVWLTKRLFGVGGDYERVERLRRTGPKMATDEFGKVIRLMTWSRGESVDLSAIEAPTLVLYGENELPFVKVHAAELAANLADVAVDRIPGAGHASNLDDPDSFDAAVRAFLDRLPPVESAEAPDGDADTGAR
jgi:pimeloyl-ACP methyl ester carboxylesterase